MAHRRGLQTEILLSLSVVMLTATALMSALLLKTHEAHLRQLHELSARSLIAIARSPLATAPESVPGSLWWSIGRDGAIRPKGPHGMPIDPALRDLAEEARARGVPLLRAGPPWEAIHFAAPLEGSGGVVATRLPPATPRALVLILLVADVAVFTAFGGYLLRRRLVLPLQRVAAAARAVGAGELEVRAPVEGVGETALVASTFNEMTEALARRSRDLEKAVSDLRESNRSLREARAGLDRAERLAAIGRLAAGVAHEVGNPMGAMLSFVDLAGRDPGLSEAGREYLLRAGREGERVRKILGQLLDFSRPLHGSRVPVAMPALCEETAALVRAQSRYARIAIEVVAEGSPPPVLADPGGVKQILLNLLLNAADALAGREGEPRIRVRVQAGARRVRAGEDRGTAGSRRHLDAVECIVEDNGPGIPAEDRERIFDPFFSTKTAGEGTGLGLSNALRLAEEFGGSLELDTSAGGPGARFALRLPVAAAGAEAGDPRERG